MLLMRSRSRRRTTHRQGAFTAGRQRSRRRLRCFVWPYHPNAHAQHLIMQRQIGAALGDPSDGMRALARVGVSFTRWQRWRIRWAVWLGRAHLAQRMILRMLDRE